MDRHGINRPTDAVTGRPENGARGNRGERFRRRTVDGSVSDQKKLGSGSGRGRGRGRAHGQSGSFRNKSADTTGDAAHRVQDCQLGKLCQNPLCRKHFPDLGGEHEDIAHSFQNTAAWGGTATAAKLSPPLSPRLSPPKPPPINSKTPRLESVTLMELAVVLCNRNGTQQIALKAIRCNPSDKLEEIRSILTKECPELHQKSSNSSLQLPGKFSFLRVVGGHVVAVSRDQESGKKAYKAKHFAPPYTPTSMVCVCEGEPEEQVPTALPMPTTMAHYNNKHHQFGAARREISVGIIEFCVRRMEEGSHYHVAKRNQGESSQSTPETQTPTTTTVLGMIRLHRDATCSEIREDLAQQLPEAPREYRFVRMLQGDVVTLLTSAQERPSCKKPLRAYHFAPPYTPQAELILLTRKNYTEGQVIADETKNRELKSLAAPLRNRRGADHPKGTNPRDMVKEKATVYINAFLNSSGGVLIFGANDDGVIERVPVSGHADQQCKELVDRVRLARSAKDDIRKLVDGVARKMEPVVDDDLVTTQFVPVRRRLLESSNENITQQDDEKLAASEDEIFCIIEIHVKPGRRSLYFVDKHSFDAYERRDGSTHLMDTDSIIDTLNNRGSASRRRIWEGSGRQDDTEPQWRGGWRQLHSAFDFDGLMRRLSDPWAGREWLFAATRQCMFRLSVPSSSSPQHATQHQKSPSTYCCGVAITGSRGMGKTSFMSELALRPKQVTQLEVVAHHLCRSDDPDTLNPALFVHSVAAMLAARCKEYRMLMTESAGNPVGDSMGSVMLRALRAEHCESDPDDAFLRGVLQPLREIEARRSERGMAKESSRFRTPVVILVDALDESLAISPAATASTTPERGPARSSSITIAHLLERAVSHSGGLPSWIKLLVSFRPEMAELPGPIQRLAQKLEVVELDPGRHTLGLHRAQEDIRIFVEAYTEKMKMSSPAGIYTGSGKWTRAMADTFANNMVATKGRVQDGWEYEEKPGTWVAFDDTVKHDLLYAIEEGANECFYMIGRHLYVADLSANVQRKAKSRETERIRLGGKSMSTDDMSELLEESTSEADEIDDVIVSDPNDSHESIQVCYLCGKLGHIRAFCTSEQKSSPRAIDKALVTRENELFDTLSLLSEGNYLYARTVLEDISSGRLEWEQVPSLPRGLDRLFTSFFQRWFSAGDTVAPSFRVVQPVLEILLAAPKRGITERDIAHAVVVGGVCDPTAVAFSLRDIQWALDIDNTGKYHLRHESIRLWLKEGGSTSSFLCREERGHKLLAASLLQRCWPVQRALSKWLATDVQGAAPLSSEMGAASGSSSWWYGWHEWEPNVDDEDVFSLVTHLTMCDEDGKDKVELLKSVGSELLDSVHRGRTTALHSVAVAGNVRAVELLLDAGADPNIVVRGRQPLHLAAGKGHAETVRTLLSAGADVAAATSSGRTALLCAAGRGSVSTVKFILDWIAENKVAVPRGLIDASQIDTGRTPLSVAAEEGHDEVIKLLLESKASVTLADRWGRTPIYYAARYGRTEPGVIKALATAPGGDVTLRWGECGNMRSPLHAAVWHGHVEIVRALLESNADPNLVENDGGGALHEAAYYGSYGHDKKKRAKPFRAAETKDALNNGDNAEESARLEILNLLLATGRCVVDQVEVHGCTALWYAAYGGFPAAVEALLNAGACVDPGELPDLAHKDRRGPSSPLLLTISRSHFDTARVLLSHGARVPPNWNPMAGTQQPVPSDLLDAFHAAQVHDESSFSSSLSVSDEDNIVSGLVEYKKGTTCEAVPREAFARWPPFGQQRRESEK